MVQQMSSDKMLVIFPFEDRFYREQVAGKAEFVGHPLADLPLPTMAVNNLPT